MAAEHSSFIESAAAIDARARTFVAERPLVALAVAAGAGFVAGALITGRRPNWALRTIGTAGLRLVASAVLAGLLRERDRAED